MDVAGAAVSDGLHRLHCRLRHHQVENNQHADEGRPPEQKPSAIIDFVLFDLGAHPPVDRVTLLLSDTNMLVNAELSSRGSSHDPWRPITRMGVYRLAAADGELTNGPSEINVDRDRYWRVRPAANGGITIHRAASTVDFGAPQRFVGGSLTARG